MLKSDIALHKDNITLYEHAPTPGYMGRKLLNYITEDHKWREQLIVKDKTEGLAA